MRNVISQCLLSICNCCLNRNIDRGHLICYFSIEVSRQSQQIKLLHTMHDFIYFGTGDGNRTHTNITVQGSLSPSCLPIPTPLHLCYISTCQRTWYFNIVMKHCYIQNYFEIFVGEKGFEPPVFLCAGFTVQCPSTIWAALPWYWVWFFIPLGNSMKHAYV